jgi:predicted alpha/beta hydrolase family esterase
MAASWGAQVTCAGAAGHLNGNSGLDDWHQGATMLQAYGVHVW